MRTATPDALVQLPVGWGPAAEVAGCMMDRSMRNELVRTFVQAGLFPSE